MKIATVLGARPQFIKAAPVSKALREAGWTEYLIHTGQHYDYGMSEIFFEQLDLPRPDTNLAIGSGSHGFQTGQMLTGIEKALLAQKPDWVLVYGDTNSTLAGALAAVKLHIPAAHVEAGLRSFNRQMPEEHNRVLTDHCADLLFCPTDTAVANLAREGIQQGVHLVGDSMYDAVLQFSKQAAQVSTILSDLRITSGQYLLATIHRSYNTDDRSNLENILTALAAAGETVVFPVHPRTRKKISEFGLEHLVENKPHVLLVEPVGYFDMLVLEQNARLILTDSGGIQKEAYFFQVPCLTLRFETEWVETVDAGWNKVVGVDPGVILDSLKTMQPSQPPPPVFGDGRAAQKIVSFFT